MKRIVDISEEDYSYIKEHSIAYLSSTSHSSKDTEDAAILTRLVDNIKNSIPLKEKLEELEQLDYELWVRTPGLSHLDDTQWEWLIGVMQDDD